MYFARNLKKLRTLYKVTQEELATAINVSQRTISHYEKGDVEPNLSVLCAIANYFNISLDNLIRVKR
ncbi:MAG: helix-turn-helix transcriptional regulator [Clostridia bacterium]